jgi:hypothetical protein
MSRSGAQVPAAQEGVAVSAAGQGRVPRDGERAADERACREPRGDRPARRARWRRWWWRRRPPRWPDPAAPCRCGRGCEQPDLGPYQHAGPKGPGLRLLSPPAHARTHAYTHDPPPRLLSRPSTCIRAHFSLARRPPIHARAATKKRRPSPSVVSLASPSLASYQ